MALACNSAKRAARPYAASMTALFMASHWAASMVIQKLKSVCTFLSVQKRNGKLFPLACRIIKKNQRPSMKETSRDLQQLQKLIDQSINRAGSFLRSSFEMPEKSLNAQQLVDYLQGMPTVVFSTVTSKGKPLTAPICALFYRGRFYIPTVAESLRAKHIKRQSAVSLSHYIGNDIAVIVHGYATAIPAQDERFTPLDKIHRKIMGTSTTSWGEGIFLEIEADRLYSFVRYPDRFR